MKILLAGEEIEMLPSFGNIKKVEAVIGSPFNVLNKVATKSLTFTDIVATYYLMQDGTAFSENVIYDKIRADGYSFHLKQMVALVSDIIGGDKNTKKKPTEVAAEVSEN